MQKQWNPVRLGVRPDISRDRMKLITCLCFSANFGKTALAIIDPFFYDEYQSKIQKMFRDAGMQVYTVCFPAYARMTA